MKNVPIEISGKWLPTLEGDRPGEVDEIWTDQTLCDTKRKAELHGLVMLEAYKLGRKYERQRLLDFLENVKGDSQSPAKKL